MTDLKLLWAFVLGLGLAMLVQSVVLQNQINELEERCPPPKQLRLRF